mmetsp:Transcript_27015/g.41505  ORF Transcript_27015/g.41505 Transcript_27015/m.41505 type:complete len:423 (+) Transcript_27015:175-1443(+)|eukprot:CAMPEP_0117015060 /NCGR_PEP_ID=MMETSP0472-20121206/12100_1 /TAXON_ID=693140 ORGANISM="Tiarina fusus, Strain LIS" /NCGR_SAMPLE_ID=MMETSP0472 /ASSEMBLY_ACC=CAM_ASM_000603 /LENGTH=422 /DNA_ID=CAMNT_0004718771 /DNA_START=163 /DNA_END=1431 /DNA_ORIENTATION=+
MGDNGGFFPWKVQDIVSAVTSAIDEAIDASHDPSSRRKVQPRRVNTAERVNPTKDVLMEDAPKEESQQVLKQVPTVTPKGSPRKSEPELVSEKAEEAPVVEFAKEVVEPKLLFPDNVDQDWELLSERASIPSMERGDIFVARAGSVRSIGSIDQSNNSSQTTLSVPFKIQRTLSSSTIDSQDNTLGPSGLGVLGVDYVEHVVLPTDTLQGICIAYKVSASSLRRANHFTGHSLHSAPKKLLIPLSKQALRTGFIRVQDTDSKEYKLHYFQAEFPDINMAEAKGYLELADWELHDAMASAREDREWEKEECVDDFKGGQIGVKLNFTGGKPFFKLRGIGRGVSKTKQILLPPATKSEGISESSGESPTKQIKSKPKVVIHSKLPSIATKSVYAEDLYKAAPEHCNFGLELKPISKKPDAESTN